MVVGCVTFYHIYLWRNDLDCFSPTSHVMSGAIMYGSYLILFCHFFYVAYFMRRSIAREMEKVSHEIGLKPAVRKNITNFHLSLYWSILLLSFMWKWRWPSMYCMKYNALLRQYYKISTHNIKCHLVTVFCIVATT